MLDFADLPYEFVPPRPNAILMALAGLLNRTYILPGKNHCLDGVDVRGVDSFMKAARDHNARFVILPNHSTHSDPQVMAEVCRRLGVKPAFMAAYEVFARNRICGWLMPRLNAFSVDREGSDRKAMKCAADILAAGKYPLVLFPEGNVYLCNDRVTPFSEGAAYIAMRAQKALGEAAPVYAVPVAMKFTHVEDVRDHVREALGELAVSFDTHFDPSEPVVDEIKRISVTALGRYLRQRGYLLPESNLHIDEQIHHAAEQLVESLEQKMSLRFKATDELPFRVRRIRAAIHSIRTNPERTVDHASARNWADEAILALRILGYYGGYTSSSPTLDRVAETVARLREDVTSQLAPPDGRRRCIVRLQEPIDLREYLAAFQAKARGSIMEVTRRCEDAVQGGLDAINATNREPGAEPF